MCGIGPPRHPNRRLSSTARDRPLLRPPARPLRVLAARRRVQDRRPRQARGGLRPAGARAHRPRRHERRRRALPGGPQARDQADPRLRDLPRRRPHRPWAPRAQPPDARRGERRRLPQPRQALQRGLPGRPQPRQADRRPAGRRALRRGDHRAHRLPGRPLLSAPHPGPPRRGARARRRPAQRLRGRERLLRGSAQRPRRAGQGQRADRADRPRARPAARRHRRRALPAQGGLPPPHGAAVRADEVDAARAEDDVRHERVLPEVQRGDGAVLLPVAGGARLDARDRRALQRRDRARQAAHPELPDARRRARARVPARARGGGPHPPLRRPALRRGPRARGDGARGHPPDGLRRVLPHRLGLHRLREEQRHRRRPGPRLGGRLDRRLLPADHRRRPAALRPALRALPQPRARLDARHRHRLLRPRARPGHALRRREVRPRVGRADRDLRQDVPARGHARRGARARARLRRGGQARQAHPGPDHGPLAVVRGLPEAGRGAAPGL